MKKAIFLFFTVLNIATPSMAQIDISKATNKELALNVANHLRGLHFDLIYIDLMSAYTDQIPSNRPLEPAEFCFVVGHFWGEFVDLINNEKFMIYAKKDLTSEDNIELYMDIFYKIQNLRHKFVPILGYCEKENPIPRYNPNPVPYQNHEEFFKALTAWTDMWLELILWLEFDVQGNPRDQSVEDVKASWIRYGNS